MILPTSRPTRQRRAPTPTATPTPTPTPRRRPAQFHRIAHLHGMPLAVDYVQAQYVLILTLALARLRIRIPLALALAFAFRTASSPRRPTVNQPSNLAYPLARHQ